MKVLIVDDEELARLRIRRYLATRHPELTVFEAEDGVHGLEVVTRERPEVVLLDIEMPGLSGFDMLRQLSERSFQVIFQTAYDQFAIKAFDANALDYLLKPFTDERLEQALAKALKPRTQAPDALAALAPTLIEAKRYLERFVVSVGPRSRVIEASEILYFLSESHVTRIVLDGIDFAYDHSLNYLEENLDPRQFVRLHRNSIASLREIAHVNRGERASVTLRSGVELPVSRERKAPLLEALTGLTKG